jgi:hypothetical protein
MTPWYCVCHRRNLANDGGGGGESSVGIRSQVRKRGKVGCSFLFVFLKLSSQKKFLSRNK